MSSWSLSGRPRPGRTARLIATRVERGEAARRTDEVAVEEPLEIRLRAGEDLRSVAVTLRTPGNDFELAAGFLFSEGVVESRDEIRAIRYCDDLPSEQRYNVVTVELERPALPELPGLERHFFTTTACGVCGKAGLDALTHRGLSPVSSELHVSMPVLASLPARLRGAQPLFARTGGLHAAALFDASGELVQLREDVGRHNAVDKLLGWALLEGRLPLATHVLILSGRASFELLQKAVAARIPVVAALSAPTNLAVELAEAFGVTLVGFLREERCNVYAHPERLELS